MLPRLFIALVALAAAVLPAASVDAAPNKPFALDVAPLSEPAGVTVAAYEVKLTNKTATQNLGSADVTIPTAFTVVGASTRGTVTADNVLQLRNLGVPPGGSVTVMIGLRMPCVSGGYVWDAVAKQSNDFSGPPGNALGPLSGNRTTTVEGSCKLRFVAQPAGTERTAQIRAEAFQPDSEQLVTVEAIDGRPAPNAQRLGWFTGTIDLRLAVSDPGTLSPSPASSPAVAGLASFSNMAIDESGNYNLRATTTAAGFSAGDSATFQVIGVVNPCRPADCKADIGGTDTSSTLLGAPSMGDGFALLSFNLGTAPDCPGHTAATSDYYEFGLSGIAADKTVIAAFGKAAVKKAGGLSKLEICFAAPDPFTAKTGPAVAFDYDGDPANGDEGFVGLLPDCPSSDACVLGRDPTAGGAAEVRFFVPAAWGDPRYGG
jgi:hypothetical protein